MTHSELTTRIERMAVGQILSFGRRSVVALSHGRYCVYAKDSRGRSYSVTARDFRTASGAASRVRKDCFR